LDNYFGLVVNSLVSAATVFMLYQHFLHLPKEFKEAASLDGCGDLRYLWHIVLPNSKAIISIFYIKTFISFWNSYIWPLLITNKENMRTIQVGITMLSSDLDTNYTVISAGITLLLIPAFVLFYILQRNTKEYNLNVAITG
jgi:sn-glycerol 3-phosphate transport system permease protein